MCLAITAIFRTRQDGFIAFTVAPHSGTFLNRSADARLKQGGQRRPGPTVGSTRRVDAKPGAPDLAAANQNRPKGILPAE